MSSSFDAIAPQYDKDFTLTPIGSLQRSRVHFFLKRILPHQSLKILEINCGTGEDALWLAKLGHEIVATDASEKMIEIGRRKILTGENPQFDQCSFRDLKDRFSSQKFDLIFSDFGGLNCASPEELSKLGEDFSFLLKPEGKLIAVIMGRRCLWERTYFLVKGEGNSAFRRKSKGPVQARVGKELISTWYYSPREFKHIFSKNFQSNVVKPVGLFIPPSYLNSFFEKKRFLLAVLNRVESIFSFSIFCNYADHFCIELRKRSSGGDS